MKITITEIERNVPATILHLDGKLDGNSYEALIDEAQRLYAAGSRDLILDLRALTFISSAGLAALHRVALLYRGEKYPVQDEGWAAFRAIDRDRGSGTQTHVKLFSPTKQVHDVLVMTGFSSLFEIYPSLDQARASFHQAAPEMEAHIF